ncbi:MAG: Na+/H+ antiporter subunit E [Myxococcota bacterium]|nr:Na+/H+ antiporter subunit E [Myxococcota bacterium]
MIRDLVLFLLLAVNWLLWSGHLFEPLLLSFGLVSCLGVTWLVHRMDRLDGVPTDWGLAARSLLYLPWLVLEILKSNLHVTWLVLHPRLPIRPQLVRGPASQRTDLGQVIYANSITLTPGTITLDLREGQVLVHAISDTTASGVTDGEMDRRVAALERKS